MKIIAWNCNGGFRNKSEKILSLNPDILIISECENIDRLKIGKLIPQPKDVKWFGDNPNKGIGVFSYGDFTFELMEEYNPNFKLVIPLKVKHQNNSFLLFCVWTKQNEYNKNASYIGQIWYAINYYQNLLQEYNSIIIGDFNSNKIWDKKRRISNHSNVVSFLEDYNIDSLYHIQFKEKQGKESMPTFFLQKKIEKPYHIDYCFASKEIYRNNFKVNIGNYEDWLQISDHTPISVNFDWTPINDTIKNSLKYSIEQKFKQIKNNKFPGIEKLREQTLIRAISYGDNEQNESERIRVINNIENLMTIYELINKMTRN